VALAANVGQSQGDRWGRERLLVQRLRCAGQPAGCPDPGVDL